MANLYGVDERCVGSLGPLKPLDNGRDRTIFLAEDDQKLAMRALNLLNMNEFEAVYLNPAVVAEEGTKHLTELIMYNPSFQPLLVADLDYQLLRDQGVDFSGIDLLSMVSELTKPADERRRFKQEGRIYIPHAVVVTSMDSAIDPESLDPELGMLEPFTEENGEYKGGFDLFGARKEMAKDGMTPANYEYNLLQTVRAIYRAQERELTTPLNKAWMG